LRGRKSDDFDPENTVKKSSMTLKPTTESRYYSCIFRDLPHPKIQLT